MQILITLLTVYLYYLCSSSLNSKRKDSLDGNRRGEAKGGHLSTLGLDALEDKVLTVTLIPTLELSSQQRSVCLSQEGVTDVGMFSAVRGQRVWSNTATFPISCSVCGVL